MRYERIAASSSGFSTLVHRDEQVQDLFDRFARALTEGDGKTCASLWSTPAIVLGDGMEKALMNSREIEEFFGNAREQYHEYGITDTRADIEHVDWLTDHMAVVSVRWPWFNSDGEEKGEESSSYVLRADGRGELKIQAALMQGSAAIAFA